MSSWRASGLGRDRQAKAPGHVEPSWGAPALLTLATVLVPCLLFGLPPGDDQGGSVVAVAPFTGAGLPEVEAEVPGVVSTLVRNSIFEECGVTVVSPAQLVEVFRELNLRQSDLCDVDCAAAIGSRLKADTVLLGEVAKSGSTYIVSGRLIDIAARQVLTAASVACVGLKEVLSKTPGLAPTLLGIDEAAPESPEVAEASRDTSALPHFDYNTLYFHDSAEAGIPPEGACRVNLYADFASGKGKLRERQASLKLDAGHVIPGPFSARVLFLRPGNRWFKLLASGRPGALSKLDFSAPSGGCVNVLVSPMRGHFVAAECSQRYHTRRP